MALTVTRALDLGDDRLEVHGLNDAGAELLAYGWVSALTNHYDDSAYSTDDTGNLTRDPAASPRAMTEAEALAYCRSLLAAVASSAAAAAGPKDLGISG